MASVSVSIAAGVLTFGVGLLGLYLKRLVLRRLCLRNSPAVQDVPRAVAHKSVSSMIRAGGPLPSSLTQALERQERTGVRFERERVYGRPPAERTTRMTRRSCRTGARGSEGPGPGPSRREGSIHVHQAH